MGDEEQTVYTAEASFKGSHASRNRWCKVKTKKRSRHERFSLLFWSLVSLGRWICCDPMMWPKSALIKHVSRSTSVQGLALEIEANWQFPCIIIPINQASNRVRNCFFFYLPEESVYCGVDGLLCTIARFLRPLHVNDPLLNAHNCYFERHGKKRVIW